MDRTRGRFPAFWDKIGVSLPKPADDERGAALRCVEASHCSKGSFRKIIIFHSYLRTLRKSTWERPIKELMMKGRSTVASGRPWAPIPVNECSGDLSTVNDDTDIYSRPPGRRKSAAHTGEVFSIG
jgi:hypothetical protein